MNNELNENELKVLAISSLTKAINDEESKEQLSTKRNTVIFGKQGDSGYNCSVGFNDEEIFLKIIYASNKKINNQKNIFIVGNTTNGDIDICYLPTFSKAEENKVVYICNNLQAIMSYYTHFNYDKKQVEEKIETLIAMIENTLKTKKTR